MIFDSAQTIVGGALSNKIRITVMGDGVIDKDKGAFRLPSESLIPAS